MPERFILILALAFLTLLAVAPSRAADSAPNVADLPLVTIAAEGARQDTAVIFLSGDGGWASLDEHVGRSLAASGFPVVGLNSLKYFWTARSPAGTATDLARIIRNTLHVTEARSVALVGYSFGADVLPFLVPQLPEPVRRAVRLVALIGAGTKASFEFHLTDWLGGGSSGMPLQPQLPALRPLPVLCICGADEKDSLCRHLGPDLSWIQQVRLGGGHHLGGDYDHVAGLLADAIAHAPEPVP